MSARYSGLAAVTAICAAGLAAGGAHAAVIGMSPNVDLSQGSYTISLDDQTSYTFSDSGKGGKSFGFPIPAVQTTGTATVASIGPPFFNAFQPTTYFTGERAPFIDGTLLANFLPYETATPIDDEFDAFVALKFDLADGVHYGFARINGLSFIDFAYESTPGVGIQATDGPFNTPAPVPLPAALPLLVAGLGGLGLLRRRRKAA